MTPPAASLGTPLERAPDNVFVRKDEAALKSWTNVFQLPVEYAVEMHNGLFDVQNPTLATRFMPDGARRRFLVLDEAVDKLYGQAIRAYFSAHRVAVFQVVIPGEEENKTMTSVDKVFEGMCEFALHRREPVVAIGGGVVLDVVGFAASMYRRGVPYIRVPTTLLAIVDASVGVKTGVDYVSKTKGPLKNRMGSFYAPCAAFLDKTFIRTQDDRNIQNGLGEIMKLALVRSEELFGLLEEHGTRLIEERFQGQDGVADRVIELSIQIMLEELGPNLWEANLERCVDYGHTFSKIIEMVATPPIMHGEAVNVDGLCCAVLSQQRGWISEDTLQRIFNCMRRLGLRTFDAACTDVSVMWKGLEDAVEHRHGKQRLPLVTRIGGCGFANDVTRDAVETMVRRVSDMH